MKTYRYVPREEIPFYLNLNLVVYRKKNFLSRILLQKLTAWGENSLLILRHPFKIGTDRPGKISRIDQGLFKPGPGQIGTT